MEIKELNTIQNMYEISQFDKLCNRAKLFLFDWLLSDEGSYCADCIKYNEVINPKMSAIEQIFNICYHRYVCEKINEPMDCFELPLAVVFCESLSSQEKIVFNGQYYIADFVFALATKTTNGNYMFPQFKDIKYIIELDGYEYHSSKQQMNKDYKREQDFQELGYRVIRFTGSQIYNEPYTCIDKLVKIIIKDIKERRG